MKEAPAPVLAPDLHALAPAVFALAQAVHALQDDLPGSAAPSSPVRPFPS